MGCHYLGHTLFFVIPCIIPSPFLGIFVFSSSLYSYISDIIRTFAVEKKTNKMDKYIILSPEAKGSFNDRLNFLYLKLGNYLDTEKLETVPCNIVRYSSVTPRTR